MLSSVYKLLWITLLNLIKTVKPVADRNSRGNIIIIPSAILSYPMPTLLMVATHVNLPKIGLVPLVYNRSIPIGFKVKTGTVIREADGWYISFTIEDQSVPVEVAEIQPTWENSKGIDLGLLHYAVTSDGEFVKVPKFFRFSEHRLSKLQERLAKKPKYSKGWKTLKGKIAKLHQLIARQRLDWQFKLAYHLFSDCQVIFLEDLQIANLVRRTEAKLGDNGQFLPNGQSAKSGLNKSLQDAALGQFVQVLEYVAWKLGKRIIKVDPKGTSQHCWKCLRKVSKSLSDRWHSCPKCGQELDRDHNSALLIQKIGLLSTQGEDITSVKTAVRVFLAEESRVVS